MNFAENSGLGGYGRQPGYTQRRVGCGSRLGLMLVFAMIGLYFFSKLNPNRPAPPPVDRSRRSMPDGLPDNNPFPRTPGNRQAGNPGDWSMEEVETKPSNPAGPRGSNAGEIVIDADGPDRTVDGDWSIEVRDGEPATSNATGGSQASPPQRTESGDWSIEEVETAPAGPK